MNEPVIKIENLSSGYDEKLILKNISLEVFPNEIMVILGTSGCGKTTLLKHLIGLLDAQQGDISLFGQDITRIDEGEFRDLLKKIGVLFQNGALLNSIPLSQNIAIPFEQHTNLPDDLIEELVYMKLGQVGLSHAYHLLPSELSGGMRKRAALARSLALDPKILFADEPGAGLDPVTALALDDLILSLKKQLGMTVVIVSHEVASIRRIADKITYLHEGTILFSGTLQDALHSDIPELKSFFDIN